MSDLTLVETGVQIHIRLVPIYLELAKPECADLERRLPKFIVESFKAGNLSLCQTFLRGFYNLMSHQQIMLNTLNYLRDSDVESYNFLKAALIKAKEDKSVSAGISFYVDALLNAENLES